MNFEIVHIVFVILFGLVIGSFLNVCIYRLPIGRFDAEDEDGEAIPSSKEKLSIFYPARSFCPHCKKELKFYHNVPVFSYIFLRGKCAFCKEKISIRYPIVEILTGICAYFTFIRFGVSLEALLLFTIFSCLIVMSFIDIDYFVLPNIMTYPMAIIGLLLSLANGYFNFLNAPFCQNIMEALCGLLPAISLFAIAWIHAFIRKIDGLGMGDIKLLIAFGLFFGWSPCVLCIFLSSIIAVIITVILRLFNKKAFSEPLPFGPYLSLAMIMILLMDFTIRI